MSGCPSRLRAKARLRSQPTRAPRHDRAVKTSGRQVVIQVRPRGGLAGLGSVKNDSGRKTGPGERVGTSRDPVLKKSRR
eukprot:4864158-Pyramimonas_sp.AAC.1